MLRENSVHSRILVQTRFCNEYFKFHSKFKIHSIPVNTDEKWIFHVIASRPTYSYIVFEALSIPFIPSPHSIRVCHRYVFIVTLGQGELSSLIYVRFNLSMCWITLHWITLCCYTLLRQNVLSCSELHRAVTINWVVLSKKMKWVTVYWVALSYIVLC